MAEIHINGPQVDTSPGPDCYQIYNNWAGEIKLLLTGPLSKKSMALQANYIMLWQTGNTYFESFQLTEPQRVYPDTLLKEFKVWIKPKSNELQAATAFRCLKQGNSTLAQFIDKPPSCVTSATILKKPINDYYEMLL